MNIEFSCETEFDGYKVFQADRARLDKPAFVRELLSAFLRGPALFAVAMVCLGEKPLSMLFQNLASVPSR
jgi:hypothetical protein